MNTQKYIDRIKERVQKKIDTLRKEAEDAHACWADTGYQRYITKKERLEKEAEKLEDFIKPQLAIQAAWKETEREEREKEELVLLLKSVRNVVKEEMIYDFPDSHATRRLEDIVKRFECEYLAKHKKPEVPNV